MAGEQFPKFSAEWWEAITAASPTGRRFDAPEYLAEMAAYWVERWEEAKPAILAGDRALLFRMVSDAVGGRHVIPAWASNAWAQVTYTWEDFGYASLDEAFNLARPKGMNVAAERRRLLLGPEVAAQIHHTRLRGMGLDESVQIAAQHFIVSEATARRWYRMQLKANPDRYPKLPRKAVK